MKDRNEKNKIEYNKKSKYGLMSNANDNRKKSKMHPKDAPVINFRNFVKFKVYLLRS